MCTNLFITLSAGQVQYRTRELKVYSGAAIARWIQSQAHHLCFYQLKKVLNCVM